MHFHKMSLIVSVLAVLLTIQGMAPKAIAQDYDITSRAEALKATTERLRGLEFINDLPVELVTSEEIAEIIQGLLDEELDEDKDRMYTEMYAMLGLMDPEASMRDAYQQMIEEQVAGLYDQYEKKFYVVDVDMSEMLGSMLGGSDSPLSSFLSGFLQGMNPDFDSMMTDTIIIHEMTHALDDQHFDLEGTLEEFTEGDSDDAMLAFQSLVEGTATYTMNAHMYQGIGMDSSAMSGMVDLNMSLSESMMDYDPFLERMLLSPYLRGEVFVNNLISRDGLEGIDAAYLDPPQSMEQILHPERYFAPRDEPSQTADPDLSSVLTGWEHEATNTLGELLIELMFELNSENKAQATIIADGWDYDVVTTWRAPDDNLAIAMVSVWDSETEAREFFDAYFGLLEAKHPSGTWEAQQPDYGLYTGAGLAAALRHEGRVVVVVEGVPEAMVDTCLDTAWPLNVTYR